jgi:hypothetical protein
VIVINDFNKLKEEFKATLNYREREKIALRMTDIAYGMDQLREALDCCIKI